MANTETYYVTSTAGSGETISYPASTAMTYTVPATTATYVSYDPRLSQADIDRIKGVSVGDVASVLWAVFCFVMFVFGMIATITVLAHQVRRAICWFRRLQTTIESASEGK